MKRMKSLLIFLLSLQILAGGYASAAPLCQGLLIEPPSTQEAAFGKWGENFNFALAEKTLHSAKSIKKIIPMKDYLESQGKEFNGSSPVFYIEFENGLRGVWKPDADITGAIAEAATYKMARRLGVKTFVPTILTEIDGQKGSLSVLIDTSIDLVALENKRTEVFAKIPKKQWLDMDLVHFLLGQWDRHAGNLLVDGNFNLAVIDNEGVSKLSLWQLGRYPITRLASVPISEKTGLDLKEGRPFTSAEVHYLDGNDPAAVSAFIAKYKINAKWFGPEQFKKFPDGKLPYITWRDAIWRQRRTKSLPPIELKQMSASTVEALKELTEQDFRELLNPEVFTEAHLEFILERQAIIIDQSQKADLIP